MNEFEEDYFEEEDYHIDEETGDWVSNQLIPEDITKFIIEKNDEAFAQLKSMIANGDSLCLNCGIIKNNLPYYEIINPFIDKSTKLYLNYNIVLYALNWLQKGELSNITPDVFNVDKNINENYILRLIKRDRINGAIRYNNVTGEYKAVYTRGTIHYGKLPYTTAELIKKLESLDEV